MLPPGIKKKIFMIFMPNVMMAFCIKNFKYKKAGSHLTMKFQKAFTANNTKTIWHFEQMNLLLQEHPQCLHL